MKIQIEMVDLINDVIVFQGSAQMQEEKNGQTIQMHSEELKYTWKCYEKGLVIESISEVRVNLTLKENALTKGHVETEYGIIDLQCKTSVYKIDEKCVEVKYDLIQGDEKQPFHFILNIYKEEGHAIH